MSATDLARITLNNTRNFLKEGKAEIYNMLKDPKVANWQHINLEKNSFILRSVGASLKGIAKSLKEYPRSAKEISKKIAKWDNEVGNQLADLVGTKNPEQALQKAQAIEGQVQELETLKNNLLEQISILIEADQLLRQSLTLPALIPIAEKSPGIKANLFQTGLETLSLITNEISNDTTQKTMSQIHDEANKLATRFAHIEIPRVPRLAEEIIFHHISLGSSATKEVITFIESLKGRLAGEMSALEQIQIAIGELYSLETESIINGLKVQAVSFGALVTGLYHKRQLKKNMDTIGDTLEMLNIYHLTLKNKLIPVLAEEIDSHVSKLNPTTISVRQTKDFFVGAKGIIRSVKMMVTSLKGQEAINELELQIILETAIKKCGIFYGKSPTEIKKLGTFIHGLIENFQRPFPYDDLFSIAKQTIATYGSLVESFMKSFDIPAELKSLTTISIPSTFGGLATKIKDKRTTFHKANTSQ